ncbi:hypothetical protein A1356_15400 [Methylomonas koyamae]|uniref:Uncharacterized protein n=2 Tax=Methylococcaceae TaxID=403 RepID=A0AA91I4L8_9GAMM|nr:hypothetical protein A1356_15400 [Methylomonas koyamae]
MVIKMSDIKSIKSILKKNGLIEMIDGQFVSARIIAKVIPQGNGTALAKNKYGNHLGYLRWPK